MSELEKNEDFFDEKNFTDSLDIDIDPETREGYTDKYKFNKSSILDLANVQHKDTSSRIQTTTIRVNGTDYPILIRETPAKLASNILNHNNLNGYTSITFFGKSGSGKSTATRTLAHYLHKVAQKKYGRSYVINWYKQRDIENIDQIIAGLERGVNRVLIFEDASFTFNYTDRADIEEVMRRLTFVRHTLQAKVICIIQLHYSKGLEKFMRDGDVKIVTSISDEEKENYYKLFGWESKNTIRKFAWRYHMMQTAGYFYSEIDMSRVIVNHTQRPFRLSLVSDFGRLHTMLYHATECEYCTPKEEAPLNSYYDSLTQKEFLQQLTTSYTVSKVRNAMKHFFYFKEGIDCLEPRQKSIMHRLTDFYHKNPSDYIGSVEELKKGKSVDLFLRQNGIIQGKKTNDEKRREKRLSKKQQYQLRKKLMQGLGPQNSPASNTDTVNNTIDTTSDSEDKPDEKEGQE